MCQIKQMIYSLLKSGVTTQNSGYEGLIYGTGLQSILCLMLWPLVRLVASAAPNTFADTRKSD